MNRQTELLRVSRLAQFAKTQHGSKIVPPRVRTKPTHQIINTTPVAHNLQEWGIKSSLPRLNNRNPKSIVLNEFGSLHNMTIFEYNGGLQYSRLRFNELHISPRYPLGMTNPLFDSNVYESNSNNNNFINQLNINDINDKKNVNIKTNLLKKLNPSFIKWLSINNPNLINKKIFKYSELSNEAHQFLNEYFNNSSNVKNKKKNIIKSNNTFKNNNIIGTGGLTYSLKGRIKNSPNGYHQKIIVPGRMINTDNSDKRAAIAGFIATDNSSESRFEYFQGDFLRDNILPFEIKNFRMEKNGKILLSTKMLGGWNNRHSYNNNNRDNNRFFNKSFNNNNNNTSQNTVISQEIKTKMLEELVDAMKRIK